MTVSFDRNGLTAEQATVLNSLINAHAEAARTLSRNSDALLCALRSGDTHAFRSARAKFAELSAECGALKLAIEVARETFERDQRGKLGTRTARDAWNVPALSLD